jgi:hypothetical protein
MYSAAICGYGPAMEWQQNSFSWNKASFKYSMQTFSSGPAVA